MKKPLVTVICLCYNQAAYVAEAIESVRRQTYRNIELIVVDDASTDDSVRVIEQLLKKEDEIRFLALKENLGNCKAFNKALALAKGEFIIDLAADDVLLPERVQKGVEAFQHVDESFGVHFTDAELINKKSEVVRGHYPRNEEGELMVEVPQGEVYRELIARYFICTPTMMMRKSVLDELDGYDEQLAYEDFDFWIRSARKYRYVYTDEILVQKRILKDSMSVRQYEKNSQQLLSTYLVCEKVFAINGTEEEDQALAMRIRYELRQALISRNFEIARKFVNLLKKVAGQRFYTFWMEGLVRMRINLGLLQRLQRMMYQRRNKLH